jgi:hypothetical protein
VEKNTISFTTFVKRGFYYNAFRETVKYERHYLEISGTHCKPNLSLNEKYKQKFVYVRK